MGKLPFPGNGTIPAGVFRQILMTGQTVGVIRKTSGDSLHGRAIRILSFAVCMRPYVAHSQPAFRGEHAHHVSGGDMALRAGYFPAFRIPGMG